MIDRSRREVSIVTAYALILLVLARPRARVLPGGERAGPDRGDGPGGGGGDGDDAGDPLPPDRHLDRVAGGPLRGGRRPPGEGRAADAAGRPGDDPDRGGARGDQRRPGGGGQAAVDRRDAGDAGDRARVAPLVAGRGVRPRPPAALPVVRPGAGHGTMVGRGDRGGRRRRDGGRPTIPGDGTLGLCGGVGRRGGAAGGAPPRSGRLRGVRRDGGDGGAVRPPDGHPVPDRRPEDRHRAGIADHRGGGRRRGGGLRGARDAAGRDPRPDPPGDDQPRFDLSGHERVVGQGDRGGRDPPGRRLRPSHGRGRRG